MEYASNEIRNMEYEHEKGNTGHSPYMKSGIWDHENYPSLEYGKRESMKLGTWNKVILKFELGNLHLPLGSPVGTNEAKQNKSRCRPVHVQLYLQIMRKYTQTVSGQTEKPEKEQVEKVAKRDTVVRELEYLALDMMNIWL